MDHPKEEGCHNCEYQVHFFTGRMTNPRGSESFDIQCCYQPNKRSLAYPRWLRPSQGFGALHYFIWDIMSL